MKIAVDIDDTILGFYGKFAEFCNEVVGSEIEEEDLGRNWWECLGSGVDIMEILREFIAQGRQNDLEFFEDFLEVKEEFFEKFDVHFVTARSYDGDGLTASFLKKELAIDPKVYFSNSHDPPRKDSLCKSLDLDLIVEDNHHNAIQCAENGVRVILIDKSWNQGVEHENIFRAADWHEVIEILNELREKNGAK